MRKSILIAGILFISLFVTGCSTGSLKCQINDICKADKKPITKVFKECYESENGFALESRLNGRQNQVYYKFLRDEKFMDTNLTYKDIALECNKKHNSKIKRDRELATKKRMETQQKRDSELKKLNKLAIKSGYKGFVYYGSFDNFIRDAERQKIKNINAYKGYFIGFDNHSNAYKLFQVNKEMEMYSPSSYKWYVNSIITIVRDKETTTQPIVNQVLNNIKFLSFKEVKNYKTILLADKQTLVFDRAVDFRVNYAKSIFEEVQNESSKEVKSN